MFPLTTLVCLVVVMATMVQSSVLCPSLCSTSHKDACMSHGRRCSSSEFCEVHQTSRQQFRGICYHSYELGHCQYDMMYSGPCSYVMSIAGFCKIACCDSQACVEALGFHTPTPRPTKATTTTTATPTTTTTTTTQTPTSSTTSTTTTTMPKTTTKPTTTTTTTTTKKPTTTTSTTTTTTTTVPTTTTTLSTTTTAPPDFSHLQIDCKDQQSQSVCIGMKSKNLCRSDVEMCPDTCGVCDVIAKFNCHDTLKADECQHDFVSKDLCEPDSFAETACPASCGFCAAFLNIVIQRHLDSLAI